MRLRSFEVIKLTTEQIAIMCRDSNEDVIAELLGKDIWLLRGLFTRKNVNKGFSFSVMMANPSRDIFVNNLRECANKIEQAKEHNTGDSMPGEAILFPFGVWNNE